MAVTDEQISVDVDALVVAIRKEAKVVGKDTFANPGRSSIQLGRALEFHPSKWFDILIKRAYDTLFDDDVRKAGAKERVIDRVFRVVILNR